MMTLTRLPHEAEPETTCWALACQLPAVDVVRWEYSGPWGDMEREVGFCPFHAIGLTVPLEGGTNPGGAGGTKAGSPGLFYPPTSGD